jgi:hypothetical protein
LDSGAQSNYALRHLLGSVANKLQAALQTENVVIFLRDGQTGDYRSAYACEYSRAEGHAVNCPRANLLPH